MGNAPSQSRSAQVNLSDGCRSAEMSEPGYPGPRGFDSVDAYLQAVIEGLLHAPGHGYAAFTVPQFDRYMLRCHPGLAEIDASG